jgi:hypothetical protein
MSDTVEETKPTKAAKRVVVAPEITTPVVNTERFVIVQAAASWFLYNEDHIGETRNKVEFLAVHRDLSIEEIAKMMIGSRVVVSVDKREDGVIFVTVEKSA